jgi:hypothetical protein
MFRFKTPHLLLLLGLIAPVFSNAADYCIAVGGGFGNGGSSFIGTDFAVPAAGSCAPWAGFTKTASSVILMTTGSACTSSTGGVLTLSAFSTDPEYFGAGTIASDYIQLCKNGGTSCAVGAGSDQGSLSGSSAASERCTTALLTLPPTHD